MRLDTSPPQQKIGIEDTLNYRKSDKTPPEAVLEGDLLMWNSVSTTWTPGLLISVHRGIGPMGQPLNSPFSSPHRPSAPVHAAAAINGARTHPPLALSHG